MSADQFQRLVEWTGFHGSSEPSVSPAGVFEFSPNDGYYRLEADDKMVCSGQTLELTFELVRSKIHRYLNGTNPETVFLQADAVRWFDGRAILIVGPSMSGKSTLARALIQAGGTSWSEHFAVLSEDSTLLGYPGQMPVAEGLPVGVILRVSYRPAAVWQPTPLTAGESALRMMELLGDTGSVVPTAMPRLAKLASQAQLRVMGERGDVETVVAYVQNALGNSG